jgi:N-acetylglutamate synthase
MPPVPAPDLSGHALLGRRVVARRVINTTAGHYRYTDVVGVLVGVVGSTLVIRRQSGDEVLVPAADLHRLHAVEPSTAQILALEEVASLGWLPPDCAWLGRWLLRAADGFTGRGNSVLPLGDPGLPLDTALSRIGTWYTLRGLTPRFQVPLPAREPLDAALAARGWYATNPSLVLAADLEAPVAIAAELAGDGLPEVRLEREPRPEWLAAYHYRGGDYLPEIAVTLMNAAQRPVFASIERDGAIIAIGRAVADDGWIGLTALEVDPAHRRQGLAVAIVQALAVWGRGQSADRIWLQVATQNESAITLYRRLGFTVHHRYHYRSAPERGIPPEAG